MCRAVDKWESWPKVTTGSGNHFTQEKEEKRREERAFGHDARLPERVHVIVKVPLLDRKTMIENTMRRSCQYHKIYKFERFKGNLSKQMWLNREYSRTQLVLGPVSGEARLFHPSYLQQQFAGLCYLSSGPRAAGGYRFHPHRINVLHSSQPFSGLSDEWPDKHCSQSMQFQSH